MNEGIEKDIGKDCIRCGESFTVKYDSCLNKRQFCSQFCANRFHLDERTEKRKLSTKRCIQCNKEYNVTTTDNGKTVFHSKDSVKWLASTFCSNSCFQRHDNRKEKTCPECGIKFKRSRNGTKGRGTFCSISCASQQKKGSNNNRWVGGKHDHICKKCGKEFKAYRKDAVFCSYKCRGHSTKIVNRGYRGEVRARNYLRRHGYSVIRSAGSKGVFDLVAYNNDEIRFIQVKKMKDIYYKKFQDKLEYYHKKDVKQMIEKDVPALASKELWILTDKIRKPIVIVLSKAQLEV